MKFPRVLLASVLAEDANPIPNWDENFSAGSPRLRGRNLGFSLLQGGRGPPPPTYYARPVSPRYPNHPNYSNPHQHSVAASAKHHQIQKLREALREKTLQTLGALECEKKKIAAAWEDGARGAKLMDANRKAQNYLYRLLLRYLFAVNSSSLSSLSVEEWGLGTSSLLISYCPRLWTYGESSNLWAAAAVAILMKTDGVQKKCCLHEIVQHSGGILFDADSGENSFTREAVDDMQSKRPEGPDALITELLAKIDMILALEEEESEGSRDPRQWDAGSDGGEGKRAAAIPSITPIEIAPEAGGTEETGDNGEWEQLFASLEALKDDEADAAHSGR